MLLGFYASAYGKFRRDTGPWLGAIEGTGWDSSQHSLPVFPELMPLKKCFYAAILY